jgi:hypothetical protein
MHSCLVNCVERAPSNGAGIYAPAAALVVAVLGFLFALRQQREELLRKRLGAARITEDDLRRNQTVLAQCIYDARWPLDELDDIVAADDLRLVADTLHKPHEWAWVTAARASLHAIQHEKPANGRAALLGIRDDPRALRRLFRAYWRCEVARLVLHHARQRLRRRSIRQRATRLLTKRGRQSSFRLHDRGYVVSDSVWEGEGPKADPILRARLWLRDEDPGAGDVENWIDDPTSDPTEVTALVSAMLERLARVDPVEVRVLTRAQVIDLTSRIERPTLF